MRIFSSLIIGISLIVGLYLAGSNIGQGGSRFRADNRSLTVKGLAEQQVKADQLADAQLPLGRAGRFCWFRHGSRAPGSDRTDAGMKNVMAGTQARP